ncbi:MAG: hypothetical protein V4613_12350 [Bacteroidota bacterium]
MENRFFKTAFMLLTCLLMLQSCKKDRTVVYINNTQPTTNNPVIPSKSYLLDIKSMWKNSAPTKQIFTGDADNGFWIIGAKGNRFYIYANSLMDASNKSVTGTVDVELIEYVSKADMLFSGVTVTAGDQLLESGGMFYLMIKQNGQELYLKQGQSVNAEVVQSNDNNQPMDLWKGSANNGDELNTVNWVMINPMQRLPQLDSSTIKSKFKFSFNPTFGFYNCDRIILKPGKIVSFFGIKPPKNCNDSNSTALIVFKQFNTAAWCGWSVKDQLLGAIYRLPVDETVKIVFILKTGANEDDLEYAVKEVVLQDINQLEFTTLTKCSKADLENMIKAF